MKLAESHIALVRAAIQTNAIVQHVPAQPPAPSTRQLLVVPMTSPTPTTLSPTTPTHFAKQASVVHNITSTSERDNITTDKRPGTVKSIATTELITCLEDLKKIALPTRLNNVKAASEGKIHTRINYDLLALLSDNYSPSKQDVVVRGPIMAESLRRLQNTPFRRLVRLAAANAGYSEPSTCIARRKIALTVLRQVEKQGGSFLEMTEDQAWTMVNRSNAQAFAIKELQHFARAQRGPLAKQALTRHIADAVCAPLRGSTLSVILQRYPIAPPRPCLRLAKQFHKKIIIEPRIMKPPAAVDMVTERRLPPKKRQFKQGKKNSSKKHKHAVRRPPIPSIRDHQQTHFPQQSTATGDVDTPRRVSCDQETAVSQEEAIKDNACRSAVNPLDLLSMAAIWDAKAPMISSQSQSYSTKRVSNTNSSSRDTSVPVASLGHSSNKHVSASYHGLGSSVCYAEMPLQRELQLQHERSVYSIRRVGNYNESEVNNDLSYIWH